jgi:YVTN family beta-propeller protein
MKLAAAVLALSLLIPTTLLGQYIETVVKLPDTLGPLYGPYHLAWDDNPAHPRLYIGGESDSGGIIVADAGNFRRLARIRTGPVGALSLNPLRGKLYVSGTGQTDSLRVVDCATNRVVKSIWVSGGTSVLCYNSINDRLYCANRSASSIAVLKCSEDTVIRTIPLTGRPGVFALDSFDNKLYAGVSDGALTAIDCARDSVVASIPRISSVYGALCLNPTAKKLYSTCVESLFAVDTRYDTVVSRLYVDSLTACLTCDPQRNRVYCATSGAVISIDCGADTVMLSICGGATGLACDPTRDKLYYTRSHVVDVANGTSGQSLARMRLDGDFPAAFYCPSREQVYCLPDTGSLTAVSCAGDSAAGAVPLLMWAQNMWLDSVSNRLYFQGYNSVGVVDCSLNIVKAYNSTVNSPGYICYNSTSRRLYSTAEVRGVAVLENCGDTLLRLVKTIPVSGSMDGIVANPLVNKVYTRNWEGTAPMDVIDCSADTLLRSLDVSADFMFLVPERNQLWCVTTTWITVVDCVTDSVVADTAHYWGSLGGVCCALEDHKLFICKWGVLHILDMDDFSRVDSLLRPAATHSTGQVLMYVPNAHKVYWTADIPEAEGYDSVYAIDSRTNAVLSRFRVTGVSMMCMDHSGDYLYCTARYADSLFVIDTRTDCVVATVQLPTATSRPILNRRENRIYLWTEDYYFCGIPVVRDTVGVGILGPAVGTLRPMMCPTIVAHGVPLLCAAPTVLYDASGRRVAALRTGLNDISHLVRGLYFRRETLGGRTSKMLVVK